MVKSERGGEPVVAVGNGDVRLMRIDLFMKYDGFLKVSSSITAKPESGTHATPIWITAARRIARYTRY